MILGIESSCDESALALFDAQCGIAGEWVYSQVALHEPFGGIVPDLASREHLARFGPLLGTVVRSTPLASVTEIAVTRGPGLAGCLALGVALARALSMALDCPVAAGNHLRGHAFSPFMPLHAADPGGFRTTLAGLLPHLGLIVSGGNTLLFQLDATMRISIVGQTVDDAAGEALDKGAKLLGMPYPGGPLIEKRGASGNANRFEFPTGIESPADMRFSFSGLKTALRYRLERMPDNAVDAAIPDICAAYEAAVVAQLTLKTRHALRRHGFRSLGLSGGVANNQRLRTAFAEIGAREGLPVLMAEPRHTGDNAAMIAFSTWLDPHTARHQRGHGLEIAPSLALA